MKKSRAVRVQKQTSKRWLKAVVLIGAVLLIATTTLQFYKSKTQSRKPATDEGVAPGVASFSFERSSDLGDVIRSSIDCPGTRLCSVEVRENGVVIAKAGAEWTLLEAFFVSYSGSPLITDPPRVAARPARELVRFRFEMGTVRSDGVVSDQSEHRRLIPFWDAMILSFL